MNKHKLKITTQLIVDEAIERGYSVQILNAKKCFVEITDDKGRKYLLRSNISHKTSAISYLLANHKPTVNSIMLECGVPVPREAPYTNIAEAQKFLSENKKIVVKPVDAAHGNGVTVDIADVGVLEDAIAFAQSYSRNILIQEFVEGDDYRLLFIGGKLAAAAIRKPAFVVGDGVHTVYELITIENGKPERGKNYSCKLNVINEAAAKRYLGNNISRTPTQGEEVQVVGTANIGAGGMAIDVTDTLSKELVGIGIRAAQALDMGLCAVDVIMAGDEVSSARLIEVNASPTFGMHEYPSEGQPRQVTKDFLDWLIEP